MRIRRLPVVALFYLATMVLLYVHLIAWPQRYTIGQIVPYSVFAPIAFDYVDRAKERDLRGAGPADSARWVIDPTIREETMAAFDEFAESLRRFRGDMVRWQKAGTYAEQRLQQQARLAEQLKLDDRILTVLLDLDERAFNEAIGVAREELGRHMSGEVTAALVTELQHDAATAVFRNPHRVFVLFLQPNLTEAPPPTSTVDTELLATVAVGKGNIVVAEGQVVTESVQDRLAALQEGLVEQAWLRLSGIGLLLLLLLFLWGWHHARVTPRVFNSASELAQQGSVFLFLLLIGLALGRLPFAYSYFAVTLVVASCAALATLIYNKVFALYAALGLASVLSLALTLGGDMTLYTAAGAFLPTVMLPAGNQRLIQLTLPLALAVQNTALALMVVLVSAHSISWHIFPIAFGAGLISSLFAFGLLPIIESLSGQVTPSKLVELASPENPLLRRLRAEAHGTWSHSQNVAELTEEACKSLNAGWLIAKVGALYHDIGKLKRPGFFAENIHDPARNPHFGLPPETSARIVKEHVSDGLLMAKEARLPRDLWCFIAEHHGTYLIRYFFAFAQQQHEADPANVPEPDRDAFRYDGPRPQSRESAVVMLADITEAVLRTKPEADAPEMLRIIEGIISDKITEGQLAESGLTLGDLEVIKAAFVRVMAAERHQRILYPGQTEAGSLHFHSRRPTNRG